MILVLQLQRSQTKLAAEVAHQIKYGLSIAYSFETSSSSYICHGVGPLVDPFRSHVSRSLFKGLPWFRLPVGQYCFITLGNLLRGILFTCCIQFLLYSSNLSKIGVIFNSFAIFVFVLWSVQVYPAVIRMYFISAAVILLTSRVLTVQFSLPCNRTGRASVLCNFILVFLRVVCGLNTLFKIPVIFK